MNLAALGIVVGIPFLMPVVDTVPKLKIEASCKAATAAGGGAGVAGEQTYEACMKDENDAADELSKTWTNYSGPLRTRCEGEAAGTLPSYVDLLICLEVAADNNNSATASATPKKVTTLRGASKRRMKK